MPASARLVLLLMQFLNYMLVEALYSNTGVSNAEGCFLGYFCADASYYFHRLGAIFLTQLLSAPAMRIVYVRLRAFAIGGCVHILVHGAEAITPPLLLQA